MDKITLPNGEIIKRHFYNEKDYVIDEVNKTITIKEELFEQLKTKSLWGRFGFKKIGGSSIGDVLKVSQFASEFAAFCRMAWVGLPILDRKYVDAGIAIEPKVIDAIEQMTGKKVSTYDPAEFNYDYFSEKDDVVGGLPDGYIDADKNVLEIKTTGEKNLTKWNQYGVPENYRKQAQLYAYLMDADKYTIVATFLKEEDYADPESYPIKERRMKNWKYELDRLAAEDDIKAVKEWYSKYTTQPTSPTWDARQDAELVEWLKISNYQELQEWVDKQIANGKIKS